MNLFQSFEISASGLNAQRMVINVIAENLANSQTTRTERGGPYLRKQAILTASPLPPPFSDLLSKKIGEEAMGVRVAEIVENVDGIKTVFDPSHPDADETGLVALPNINLMEEMVVLLSATRVYEANVSAFNAAKNMALKALEIGNR